MNKLLHTAAHVIKQVNEGVIEAIVGSSNVLDRQGEIIDQGGWDIKNFQKNPVILWGHNVRGDRPPIGKALKVWKDGEGKGQKLMFKVQFDLQDSFAAEIYRKVKDGFVNTVSVGFMPMEREDNRYTKAELLELSFVPVPANPEAVVVMREMGIEAVELKDLFKQVEDDKKDVVSKNVVPFETFGMSPESEGWDGQGEIAKADVGTLKGMSAWFDSEKASDKSVYKLVHHRFSDKKAVFRGVVIAMASLMGAKGGVEIPDEDRKAVYEHLAKHYEEFGKKAPDYSMVENQVFKSLEHELHALTLDREEKHIARLVKEVISIVKAKEPKTQIPQVTQVKNALTVIETALTLTISKMSDGREV